MSQQGNAWGTDPTGLPVPYRGRGGMFASSAHGSSFPKSDGRNSTGNCVTIGRLRKPPRLKSFDRCMADETLRRNDADF